MRAGDEALLRVGELARRSGLTVRTLHHYDQIGLLQPGWRSGGSHRLYDADDLRRLLAIQHLKGLGLSLGEVQAALDEPSFDAAALLAEHIRAVEARLADEQALLRRLRGLQEVAAAGWEEVLEVVALTERLEHPDPSVRVRAALESPRHAPLATLVAQLATEPDPSVRETLTWAVVQHGPAATAEVTARLADGDGAVRLQMAHVLGKLADPAAIEPLVGLLEDPEPLVAAKAAFALGQLGRLVPDGGIALPALVAGLGQGDEVHRDTVGAAVALIGGAAAVVAVAARLADEQAAVRGHAAEVLGLLGAAVADDHRTTEALVGVLDDVVGEVAFQALLALGQLLVHDRTGRITRAVRRAAGSSDRHTALLARRLLQR